MRDGMWREDGRVLENIVSNDEQTCLSNVSDDEDVKNQCLRHQCHTPKIAMLHQYLWTV